MGEHERPLGQYEESRPYDDKYDNMPRNKNGSHSRRNKNNGDGGNGSRSQRGYPTEDYYGPPPRRGGDSSYGQIGFHVTSF